MYLKLLFLESIDIVILHVIRCYHQQKINKKKVMNKVINKKINIKYSKHSNERMFERNINKSAINEMLKLHIERNKLPDFNINKKICLSLSKFEILDLIFEGYDLDKIDQLKNLTVVIVLHSVKYEKSTGYYNNLTVKTVYENSTINDSLIRNNLVNLKRKEVFQYV